MATQALSHRFSRKALLALAGVLCALLFIFLFPAAAHAEDTGSAASASSIGENDVTLAQDEAAPAGSAAIVEQKENATNAVTTPQTFENDPASPSSISENAIQKAVDKALTQITADTSSVTIDVSAGTYNGDISINGGGYSLPTGFKLYLLASDAYTKAVSGALIDSTAINAGSAGAAVVNGNITVDGVDVVLAGLYMSLGKLVTAKDASVTVYGTKLDDTVSTVLDGDKTNVTVHGGSGNDTLSASAGSSASRNALSSATLYGEDGDDTLTVDTSAANAVGSVQADGGAGSNRLHLTGALKKDGESSASLVSGVASIHLQNEAGQTVDVVSSNMADYTDALKNKPEITISASEIASGTYTANALFTNYLLKTSSIGSLTVTGSGFLSSLTVDGGDSLAVGTLDASGLNLTLTAKQITVSGALKGRSIFLTALDDDKNINISASDLGLPSDYTYQASIMDVVSGGSVMIGAGASVNAAGSVVIKAGSEQTSALLPLGAGFNFVSVKVGSADIDILGAIVAAGSVTAAASSLVNVAASNSSLAKWFIPLAVAVVVASSNVRVGDTGSVTAGGSVSLSSKTDVTMTTASTAGKLPISLAVSVAVVDSHVLVKGNVTSQAGSITLDAKGNVTVTTTASNKTPETKDTTSNAASESSLSSGSTTQTGTTGNTFGGFFAFSIVIQDVDASVQGAASLFAARDIDINSTANEKVTTTATSAAPEKAGDTKSEGSQSMSSVADIVKTILGGAATKLGAQAKAFLGLNKAVQQVAGTDGRKITAQTTTNGSVTVPAKVKAGETATVTAKPKDGYALQALTYTYLPAGQSAQVTKSINISGGGDSFTFTMPDADVTLVAVFRQRTASDPADTGVGNLFDEGDDDSLGISDLFNEGTSGTGQSSDTGAGATGAYTIAPQGSLSNGALVPATASADAGKEITVTVNPATGYQLKDGTLKATCVLDGRTTIQTLTKNADGKYILTMPAGNVTLSAEFEQAPGGTTPSAQSGGGNSSSQAVGAVAVGVAINNNDAFVNTTGTIHAGGTLSLCGTALTQSSTTADGSPIASSDAQNTGATNADGTTDTTGDVVTQEQQVDGKPVLISATVNGEVDCVSSAAGSRVAFQVTPRQGYKLTAGSLKFSYTDPATSTLKEVELTAGSGGNYYFDIPAGLPADAVVTVSASFEADSHAITVDASLAGKVTAPATAKTGDTVTLTVTPGAGNTVVSLKFNTTVITEQDGKFTFIMPAVDVTITASFAQKSYEVRVDDAVKNYLTVSDTRADAGETVTVTTADQAGTAGKKLNSITATLHKLDVMGDEFGTETLTVTDGKFVMPNGADIDFSHESYVVVSADFADKGYAITIGTMTNGAVTAPARADSGEKIQFTVTPSAGYKLKANSLKAKSVEASVDALVPITADAQGNYYYTLPTVAAGGTLTVTILAEFVTDPDYTGTTTPKKSTFSLGVGVTVAVTVHNNNAYIKAGTIQAGSLSVTATSGSEDKQVLSSAASKAGYSQGDFGIGGAITVHVATVKTNAQILPGVNAYILEEGDVNVAASSNERFVTSAESASPDTASGKVGVGAGIAVAVTGVDVVAKVDDNADIIPVASFTKDITTGAYIPQEGGALGALTVSAGHASSEAMLAKAGSKGGVSITPVLALDISGVYVSAYMGAATHSISSKGDVRISAENTVKREVAANAAASGGSVGVGASFMITVLNDSASSVLKRNARARSVTVRAVSRSSLISHSRAGSQGATSRSESSTPSSASGSSSSGGSEEGEADAQADRSIAGGSSLTRRSGSTNTNQDAVSGLTTNRQTSQTSEGNIQIAAGFNLNILSNHAEAAILSAVIEAYVPAGDAGDSTPAAGSVNVETRNDTDAAIYSDASATNAKIGVGVAVAINIVHYENIAHIDAASVTAVTLNVTALMEDPSVSSKETQSGGTEEEDQNIVETLVKKAITQLVNSLADQMGLSSVFDTSSLASFLGNLIGDIAAKAAQTLLTGTGLEKLIGNDIGQKIEERVAQLSTLDSETYAAVKEAVLSKLLAMLSAKVSSAFKPAAPAGDQPQDTLTSGSSMEAVATSAANELFSQIVDVSQLMTYLKGDVAADLKQKATQILSDAGKALTTAALDALSGWLNLKIEPEDTSPAHTFVTQAVAGAGASSVGVAGSAAVAVITGVTKAYLAVVDQGTNPVAVSGDLVINAYSRQKVDTTASSAVGADGTADKNLNAGSSSDTGSGADAGTHDSTTNGKLVIGAMTNGTVTAAGAQTAGSTVTLTISPDEGYKAGTVKATRSDTGAAVALTQNADGTYSFAMPSGLAEGATITIAATFAENTHTVTVSAGVNGNVTVKAPADSAAKSSTSAKMNDKLLVTVKANTGYKLKAGSLSYTYTPEGGSATTKQIIVVENAANGVYTFYMPDADVTISSLFEADSSGSTGTGTNTTPTNSSGKTVGVGAAFALNIVYMTVEAGVGANRSVTAKTASIRANGKNDLSTISVSGSDPLSGETGSGTESSDSGKAKDISVDASAAVGLIYNIIRAYVEQGASVTTTGGNTVNSNETKYDTEEETAAHAQNVNFYLGAIQSGSTLTKASGFAVGGSTSVGAAVAVNIAYSDVLAQFLGTGRISGTAKVYAHTFDEDNSTAVATAMGADLERYLQKFRKGVSGAEKSTNDVLNGNYSNSDTTTNNSNNQTAGKINGELNKNNNSESGANTNQSNNNLPLSTNALRSQDASTTGTPNSATGEAQNNVNSNAGTSTIPTSQGAQTQGQKIQVAAAVAVNVTHHCATASMLGDLQASAISVLAENNGNFRTLGTGIAMSLAQSSTSIAVGVAVSVNKNESTATLGGTATATGDSATPANDGKIEVTAGLTQNMDGEYKGWLGAQALAGVVSGQGNAAIGGALAIIVSFAATKAQIAAGAVINGGDISVLAFDKSKLAVRAGGVSISTGAKVGVGASFALVYAHKHRTGACR